MLERTKPIAQPDSAPLTLRQPTAEDGAGVWRVVADCPPLDRNSLYCNLLQCSDFADTCVLAELDGEPLAWVSGYRPPTDPSALFVWQVAVRPEARGLRLAKKMIVALLERPACEAVNFIKATITPNNKASWSLFESVADALEAPFHHQPRFDEEMHFQGRHESEHLVTIGPIPKKRTVSNLPVAPV